MKLTRRDALAALSAGGLAVAGATVLRTTEDEGGDEDETTAAALTDHERATIVAVAGVVYPSTVDGVERFVATYLDGRLAAEGVDEGVQDGPAYAAGAREAIDTLDEFGEMFHDGRFVDVGPDRRDRVLREVGADTADADPEGSPAERVRYYLVNELLYAFYTSPTGGELVGIENPQGHPGGTDSYRRGPDRE